MFTGIITAIGTIGAYDPKPEGGVRFVIKTPWDCRQLALGASVACNGICLTVVSRDAESFAADASAETLGVTTLGQWNTGTRINLESSLKLGDEMGGHIVSGHVDGLAELLECRKDGDSWRLRLSAPPRLASLIAAKGSVALDGISLTVNEVDGNSFGVMIIPHTWEHTTLCERKPGDKINLEADMLARYVARILNHEQQAAADGG